MVQFLWRNGGPKSKFPLIHSVWANFQTSTSNVSYKFFLKKKYCMYRRKAVVHSMWLVYAVSHCQTQSTLTVDICIKSYERIRKKIENRKRIKYSVLPQIIWSGCSFLYDYVWCKSKQFVQNISEIVRSAC